MQSAVDDKIGRKLQWHNYTSGMSMNYTGSGGGDSQGFTMVYLRINEFNVLKLLTVYFLK